jgi:hypothetical protein
MFFVGLQGKSEVEIVGEKNYDEKEFGEDNLSIEDN